MSKIFSGRSRWDSGCCAAVAPRGGHSPKPPSEAPAIATGTGGRSYGGVGMRVLGHRPHPRAAIASRREGAERCKNPQQPPSIFRRQLGEAAPSRIIGSLSALRRRDTPPLRPARTTLYVIDFSFSKAGIKRGRNGGSTSHCVPAAPRSRAPGTGGKRVGTLVRVAGGPEPGPATFCQISFLPLFVRLQ